MICHRSVTQLGNRENRSVLEGNECPIKGCEKSSENLGSVNLAKHMKEKHSDIKLFVYLAIVLYLNLT